jgi:glutathione S-transferase
VDHLVAAPPAGCRTERGPCRERLRAAGLTTGNFPRALVSLAPSLVRLARGTVVKGHRKRPRRRLELYEAEYCPFCRHVRETLAELDLDALIHLIPKKGSRFKQQLVTLGGKAKVPFLHDPNTGKRIYDSEAIANYLYEEYGPDGQQAPPRLISTSALATSMRGTRGMFARASKAPGRPLELYSFESSPYARLVREKLCELELPYVLHNVGKGPGKAVEWLPPVLRLRVAEDYVPHTQNRRKLQRRGGRMQVPYLVDPNTKVAM